MKLIMSNIAYCSQSVSPGMVKTEMPPEELLKTHPYLNAEDITNSVLYILGNPPHVQVHSVLVANFYLHIYVDHVKSKVSE